MTRVRAAERLRKAGMTLFWGSVPLGGASAQLWQWVHDGYMAGHIDLPTRGRLTDHAAEIAESIALSPFNDEADRKALR